MKRSGIILFVCFLSTLMVSGVGFAELSKSRKDYCEMQDDPKECIKRQKEIDENLQRTIEYNKAIKKEKKEKGR